ncbi:hypothetical protein AB0J74_14005 [Asanoa sp. NPDC049573]
MRKPKPPSSVATAADLDSPFLMLLPDSPEFRERYAEQLRKVVARLS